ncbi:MAG: hypothetical protein Q4E02_05960, partial [Lagierella massiliensis]|nr:hypothetical protein [Lagierella massiliensis]
FNIFQPDYVVFETAQYVFNDNYYNRDLMKGISFNPPLMNEDYKVVKSLDELDIEVQNGEQVSVYSIVVDGDYRYGYVKMGDVVLDLKKDEDIWRTSFDNEDEDTLEVIFVDANDNKVLYK